MASHGLLVACRPKDHHDSRFKSKIRDPSRLRFTIMIQILAGTSLTPFTIQNNTTHDSRSRNNPSLYQCPSRGILFISNGQNAMWSVACVALSFMQHVPLWEASFWRLPVHKNAAQLPTISLQSWIWAPIIFSRVPWRPNCLLLEKKNMRLQSVFFVHLVLLFEWDTEVSAK